MRRMLGCLVVLLAAAATVGSSQQGGQKADPFNGTWEVNIEKTKEAGRAAPRPFTRSSASKSATTGCSTTGWSSRAARTSRCARGRYDSKYNGARFVPHNGTVFPPDAVGMEVMTVKVDERTHYRIARTRDGDAQYAMMRRLSKDGQSYIPAGLHATPRWGCTSGWTA